MICLTAAVRDLHACYPNRFKVSVETTCPQLWDNNPHVIPAVPGIGHSVECEYPRIHTSNHAPGHFIEAFHDHLNTQLDLRLKCTEFKGDIHLSNDEKSWMSQVQETGWGGQFWIVMAGGKFDFTAKWYPWWQQVADGLKDKGIRLVQCGEKEHHHPSLTGHHIMDLRGHTDMRQFIRLMYHASGVICPVTMAMHLAAAVEWKDGDLRPCVVVAGGREPVHWEAYPGHQFIHRIGAYDCCSSGGCWRSRAQTVGDADEKDQADKLCELRTKIDDTDYAECMVSIKPEEVIRNVEMYL